MIRIDLHVHSSASFDSSVSPLDIAKRSRQLGLTPVFLTDHNTIEGALDLSQSKLSRVVVGQEVMTRDGEMIGLFLTEMVPAGLGARETAECIQRQGGLVYLEHPYDPSRRHLTEESIEEIAKLIDIVEVFNGRSDRAINRRAQDLCDTIGAAAGAGSDAHTLPELGSVFTEMPDFDGPVDFLAKLRKGKIVVGRSRLRMLAEARLRRRR